MNTGRTYAILVWGAIISLTLVLYSFSNLEWICTDEATIESITSVNRSEIIFVTTDGRTETKFIQHNTYKPGEATCLAGYNQRKKHG